MGLTLPLFLLLCLAAGALRRVPVYDAFAEGAKEGLKTAWSILPSLTAMLCAIRAFSACGLLDALCGLLAPAAAFFRLPKETLPLMLLRPVSGSASLAMLKSILHACGPDSRAGLVASVMMGSSETVFYTCGVYLSAAGVKKSRYTIPCALLAWLAGSAAAGWVTAG
jgi:spore maturation protein B